MFQKGFAPILILIGIFIVTAVAGGVYYFGKNSSSLRGTNEKSDAAISHTPSPTYSPSPSMDETSTWKVYEDADYNFKHPSDWSVVKIDYSNSTQITNKNQTVTITILEEQYPYGYGGDDKFDTRDIKITVGNKEYSAKENVVNDKDGYVDFKLDTSKNYHVLFGTGYPAGCCGKTSLEDYKSSFETILKILSTFKFTQ